MFLTAYCDGGYTTNLPLTDVLNGRAFVGLPLRRQPLAPEHGGPARLVVPHLYLWKSAKWVRGLRLMDRDSAASGNPRLQQPRRPLERRALYWRLGRQRFQQETNS